MATDYRASFIGGEITKRLAGRVDLASYQHSCLQLQNFLIIPGGGVERVPGTKYIADGYSHTEGANVRLVAYERTATDSYILEFSNVKLRIFKSNASTHTGALLPDIDSAGGTQVELTGPYTTAQLRDVKFAMSGNVIYMTHPSVSPRTLTWTADDDWDLATPSGTKGGSDNAICDLASGPTAYPRGCTLFESRLIACGPSADPQAVLGSKSPANGAKLLTNFTQGSTAGDSWYHAAANASAYTAQWVVGHSNNLLVGTDIGEAILFGDPGTGITPLTPGAKFQSSYGSTTMQGLLVNNRVLFVQQGGRRVRELVYVGDANQYAATDLTIKAEHITEGGLVEWAFQSNPYSLLWCVRGDGVLAVMAHDAENGIQAWTRVVPGGDTAKVESIAVVNGNANEQQVWMSVTRKIDGVHKRFIEVLQPRDWGSDDADACFSHASVSTTDDASTTNIASASISAIDAADPCKVYTGTTDTGLAINDYVRITEVVGMTELNDNVYKVKAEGDGGGTHWVQLKSINDNDIDATEFTAYTSGGEIEQVTTVITGLDHLEGEAVIVQTDGYAQGPYTVASNQITVDRYGNKHMVGLSYESVLEPTNMVIQVAGALDVLVTEFSLQIYQTGAGGQVGVSEDKLSSINIDHPDLYTSGALPYKTGEHRELVEGSWNRSSTILVKQTNPLPLTILGMTPIFRPGGKR